MKTLIALLSLLFICSIITVGQGTFSIGKAVQAVGSAKKSRQGDDALNFRKINEAMEPELVIIGDDSFYYKKISPKSLAEVCDYPPYNAQRKEAYKALSRDLDHLDDCISGVANKHSLYYATKVSDLKTTIDNFKRDYPQFAIGSYETIYAALQQRQDNEKEQERLAEIERQDREAAYEKAQDSLKTVAEQQQKQASQASLKDDGDDSKTMMTVEEGGQEYEIGTRKEYHEQAGLASQSSYLCRFMGFKFYWVLSIPKFLVEEGTFDLQNAELGANNLMVINMIPSSRTQALYGKLQVKAKVDKDGRVTSMVVTGNPVSLIHLFLWYWPTTPRLAKGSNLKSGLVYKKQVYDESITFNYTATPSIVIAKVK
ncbi:hypothetical protein Q4E93_33700 [Flavitalea sp. BT771]|uniref:hypothetical protein n=1 Tax=Flavitalea sp. BT771 TaxID=3063329 RepID=UPI0026E26A0A|nr:hypothetical protein [Flavitalea sp. BT771]MDO6435617.1 hypothetical protein [Flavitalea sp. BT771]MDV6224517.1 hypothetical protein [Flavitalea sp. BT771]